MPKFTGIKNPLEKPDMTKLKEHHRKNMEVHGIKPIKNPIEGASPKNPVK